MSGYAALGISDALASAALGNLGRAYTLLGRPEHAAGLLRRAVEWKRRNHESAASRHTTLTNLSLALQAAGDPDGAEAALADALRLPGLGPGRRERVEQEQAYQRMNRGDFAGALVMLRRSLDTIVDRERKGTLPRPSRERGTVLNNIGACYSELRNWTEARRYFEEAVRVRRLCAPGSIELANAIGNLAGLPDRPPPAELLDEAVGLGSRVAPASPALAVARAHRAGELLEAGDHAGALRLARQTIDAAPAANRNLAQACLVAARAHDLLGDPRAGEAMALRAYQICSKVSTRLRELQPILTMLGGFARRRDDLDAAAARYDEAIVLAERYRLGSAREPGLERWFGATREVYHGRIEVSARRQAPGDAEAAFAAAEAFRARTLAELLSAGTPAPIAADPTQHRLAAIYTELDTLAATANPSPAAEPDGSDGAVDRASWMEGGGADDARRVLEAERDALEARAERERLRRLAGEPVSAQRDYPVPCTVPEIQAVLGAGVMLALYEVTDDDVFRWTVTRDSFDFRRLEPGAAELRVAVGEVLDSCGDPEAAAPAEAAWRRLGEWLLAGMPPDGRLVVCADATLAYLPFEALTDRVSARTDLGGVRRTVVSYAPSATTLVRFGGRRRARVTREFAGFAVAEAPGLPRIPAATREIEAAAACLSGETVCLSGPDASAEAVRTYAPGSRYVHFAVHALARDDEPLYSALALAAGPLHAYELFSLDLGADVVTLSACASAVGADRSGEGIVGLSRALFAAGARAVLLTRWPVHDRPMRTLVEAFYRSLSEGHPPAEALAEAVRLVRRSRPAVFAHPRERWPFMLIETGRQ